MSAKISGHGHPLASLKQKIICAANNGITVVYVHSDNYFEAMELELDNLKIVPFDNIEEVIELIWKK